MSRAHGPLATPAMLREPLAPGQLPHDGPAAARGASAPPAHSAVSTAVGASGTGVGAGVLRDMHMHLFDPSAAEDAFQYRKLRRLGEGAFGVVYLCEGREDPGAGVAAVPRRFALKEVASPNPFYPNAPSAHLADSLPLNEPALQFYHEHPNIVKVHWAHVVCLDPGTGKPLHVTANQLWGPMDDYLSPPEPHSGPVGGAAMPPDRLAGAHDPLHGNSAWHLGDGPPGARAMHDGRPGHSRVAEGADGVERTALPLEMYSDMIHVCIDGPSPPDAQPSVIPAATASHAHPDTAAAGPAPRVSAYPPIGPETTVRVLHDPRSDAHVADALEEQAALLNGRGSSPPDPPGESPPPDVGVPAAQHGAAASPPPGARHPPPAQAPAGAPPPWGHHHVPCEAAAEEGPRSVWRCRVERACRVAAAQSHAAAGAADLDAAVQLQMRIAMEYCDLGSLADCLSKTRRGAQHLSHHVSLQKCGRDITPLRCMLLTALDVAEALHCMHASSIMHGDLKPHNILLVSDPEDDRGFHAKVADFGLAVHMAKESTYEGQQGTEAYLPPQVFLDHELTQAGDVYALGLVLWEMLHGVLWCYVWAAEKQKRGIQDPLQMDFYRPLCNGRCPPLVATLIYKCIRSNPNSRPSAEAVCSHLYDALEKLEPPAPPPRGHAAHAIPAAPDFQVPPGLSHAGRSAAQHSAGVHGAAQHGAASRSSLAGGASRANPGAAPGGAGAGFLPPTIAVVVPPSDPRLPGQPPPPHARGGVLQAVPQHGHHAPWPHGAGASGAVVHGGQRLREWKQRDDEDEQARGGPGWFDPVAANAEEGPPAEAPREEKAEARDAEARPGCWGRLQALLCGRA